jgi:putative ABC transport system permease protein
MVQVLTGEVMAVQQVQDSIEAMGFRTQSILDEIAEVRRAFVIMNGLLAMIGGVSLIVAAMMIVNTLVMAVLERTREIGLLKSMGATDTDVTRLFLTEAGVIGIVGGVGGLVLGYVVARVTNAIANYQFERVGEVKIDLVAFSFWLILGGLAFALFVSLAAGFYPARRAAKVDPVVALRHY